MNPAARAVWDPGQYLKFSDDRLRPALDLMARVPRARCTRIWDLGCGPGNVTRLLAERWPGAAVSGLDSSLDMLAKARGIAGIDWVQGDIAAWHPPEPADLIYSNAALHWVRDHRALFPRLMSGLASGGVLAVQMPNQRLAASHRLLADVAASLGLRDKLVGPLAMIHVDDLAGYYHWLAPHAATVDLWETEYLHVLRGADPVVEWVRGSALKPLLDALSPDEAARYLAAYAAQVARAYPPRADGTTLYPFRRLFIVAVR